MVCVQISTASATFLADTDSEIARPSGSVVAEARDGSIVVSLLVLAILDEL